ncbi:MAG: hypothetical protein RIE06_32325 [Roseibium album]|uniref:rhamnosyltransferase WsaF family glycosyltransferase n=1 Tax=Roseibium album TaxID=311410 RepID=UPI002A5CCEEC|nr:hypothetical protein [Paracoccaceae bacterium]
MKSVKARVIEVMPGSLRESIKFFRRIIDPAPIETRVLRDYNFAEDTSHAPRITLIMPYLSQQRAFGGVKTAYDFFAKIVENVKEDLNVDVRILVEEAYDENDTIIADAAGIEIESLKDKQWTVTTRRREIFLVFNWWISLNLDRVVKAQARHFDQELQPKFYLLQEYEPNFYPFSSANLLATGAVNSPEDQNVIFNTKELFDYYTSLENRCRKSYVFEPMIASALKPHLDGLNAQSKKRIILIYGRRGIERNCFTILEAGLGEYASMMPTNKSVDAGGWRIVSAGLKHADINLGNGFRLESVGKLSIDDYGQLLRQSAVGVSLMASPHPSYPPLEMAHFGLRTLTNNYANKDMSKRHENLLPLKQVTPANLGECLKETCETFEKNPELGIEARSFMPSFMSGESFYSCIEEVSKDIIDTFEA